MNFDQGPYFKKPAPYIQPQPQRKQVLFSLPEENKQPQIEGKQDTNKGGRSDRNGMNQHYERRDDDQQRGQKRYMDESNSRRQHEDGQDSQKRNQQSLQSVQQHLDQTAQQLKVLKPTKPANIESEKINQPHPEREEAQPQLEQTNNTQQSNVGEFQQVKILNEEKQPPGSESIQEIPLDSLKQVDPPQEVIAQQPDQPPQPQKSPQQAALSTEPLDIPKISLAPKSHQPTQQPPPIQEPPPLPQPTSQQPQPINQAIQQAPQFPPPHLFQPMNPFQPFQLPHQIPPASLFNPHTSFAPPYFPPPPSGIPQLCNQINPLYGQCPQLTPNSFQIVLLVNQALAVLYYPLTQDGILAATQALQSFAAHQYDSALQTFQPNSSQFPQTQPQQFSQQQPQPHAQTQPQQQQQQ